MDARSLFDPCHFRRRRTFSSVLIAVVLAMIATATVPSTPASAAPDGAIGLPDRVVGGYWTYWGAPRLADVPAEYNTVYLFSARPVGGQPGSTGAVFFEQSVQTEASLVADIAALRSQGRAVILSVGGAGEYLNINTRAREDAFVASIVEIHDRLGGFDGLDWNIESSDLPVANMVSASQRLKQRFGSDFAITTPPAPWRAAEMTFVRALRDAGALDLVTPQYYDLTGLNTEAARRDHAVNNIGQWVTAAGGADKVGFGFRNVGAASETMSVASSVQVWQEASARHPGLRGAMVWSIDLDRGINYRFARDMAAVIHD
jgi:chitinase